MKISKIFAGMSALAIAASAIMAVGASADEAKIGEIGFYAQNQGGSWEWYTIGGDDGMVAVTAPGKYEVKVNYSKDAFKPYAPVESWENYPAFGIQLVNSGITEVGDKGSIDASVGDVTVTYDGGKTVTVAGFALSGDQEGKKESWGMSGNNVAVNFQDALMEALEVDGEGFNAWLDTVETVEAEVEVKEIVAPEKETVDPNWKAPGTVWEGSTNALGRAAVQYVSADDLALKGYAWDNSAYLVITFQPDGNNDLGGWTDTWNATIQADAGKVEKFYDGKDDNNNPVSYLIDLYKGNDNDYNFTTKYAEDGKTVESVTGNTLTYVLPLGDKAIGQEGAKGDLTVDYLKTLATDGLTVGGYNVTIKSVAVVSELPSDSSENSTVESQTESKADESSTADSSSVAPAKTNTKNNNPNTGAAALAAVGVALAGAAVVASKKRK